MHAPATPADRKHSDSLLAPVERALVAWLMPLVPRWIHTQHLTLMTIVWSMLVLGASALARHDSRWMWAVSVAIALQYLTDAIDGKVGKLRGDGLVRWGYYMDHLLDYVFLSSMLIGYMLLLPGEHQYLMMLALAVSAGFMASAFLARAVTGVLPISYLRMGPIELRLVFIGINVLLSTIGRAYMVAVVPYVLGVALVVLCSLVYSTQRTLWKLDRDVSK